jgi:predicted outer membrane repeat protein
VGNGIVDLTGAAISSNTASNDGGAIRNEGSSVNLTDSFFTTNTSGSDGGGIFSVGSGDADAQVTLDNTGFTVNIASAGNGGALYNGLGSTATLLNGTVLSEGNNAGANGGGIYNHLGGTVTLDNSAVLGNVAQNSGGGIYNIATMTIENSSSIGSGSNGNFTTDGEGGGIFNQGTLTIRDSSVAGNRTSPGAGTADASGGGIFNQGLIVGQGLLTLDNVLVQSNSTGDGDNSVGGGIASTGVNATMTISGSVINDNSTGSGLGSAGGGIYNDASLELQGSTLSGNSTGDGADAHGGALITTPDGTATLLNTTISGNQTGTGDPSTGGAIYAAGDMTLLFSTIAENAAGTDAGGIFVSADTAVILRGVILAGNMVAGQPNNCADPNGGMVSAGSNLLGEHNGCTTAFNDGDNGDIVGTPDAPIDPLLGPLTDNGGPTPTHALLDASPAINAALPDMCVALDLSPIATDQRGESRPFGPTCDIGAFERGPVAPTDVTISGPTEGVVDATHTFSATVGIANTTLPITYTWTAEDQESVQQTNVDALTTTVGFVWDTPGTRSITVTADNGAGMVTSMVWLFNVLESDTTDPTPGDENLLTGVQISGPPSGVVGLDQVFNATVTPITITTPITYTWEAGGQAPVVETGGGISATPQAFSWDTPGTRAVTVTADNGSGAPVVDTAQIEIVEASITETLITAISLNGPTTGDTGQSYAFTAQVTPADATVPITYTWTTSDEQEQVQTGGGTSAQAAFSWDSAGTYTVTVTTDNSIGEPVSASQAIAISATSQPGDSDTRLYLPFIAR